MRIALFVCVFVLGASSLTRSAQAEINWLQFFFPSLSQPEKELPAKTLRAPFADPAVTAMPKEAIPAGQTGLPENHVPLDSPHKSAAQVAQWVTSATAGALTFTGDDYDKELQANAVNFDLDGRKQYLEFLRSSGLLQALDSRQYHIRSFLQEVPILLNRGAAGERYHWLYETSVMISYLERGEKDYKRAKKPINQFIKLTVQVGRTKDETAGKDLVIESWAAQAKK